MYRDFSNKQDSKWTTLRLIVGISLQCMSARRSTHDLIDSSKGFKVGRSLAVRQSCYSRGERCLVLPVGIVFPDKTMQPSLGAWLYSSKFCSCDGTKSLLATNTPHCPQAVENALCCRNPSQSKEPTGSILCWLWSSKSESRQSLGTRFAKDNFL